MRLLVMMLLMACASSAWAQDRSADEEPKGPDPRIAAVDAATRANELASKGKFNDAVPYYEKAIRLDGLNQELAYYNLAEVQKVRGNCRAAVVTIQLYASIVGSPKAREEADAMIKSCRATDWPTLQLATDPKAGGELYIDDMLASPTGTFGPAVFPPGTYEVRFVASDHHPDTRTVTVKAEPVSVTRELKKMTFFGTITVKVNVPGAEVRVFEGPSKDTELLHEGKSPVAKPVKAREGRHFVEVTMDGYDRWIRNVSVGRDVDTQVDVELQRSLPPEIR